jgi:hypothetical protein
MILKTKNKLFFYFFIFFISKCSFNNIGICPSSNKCWVGGSDGGDSIQIISYPNDSSMILKIYTQDNTLIDSAMFSLKVNTVSSIQKFKCDSIQYCSGDFLGLSYKGVLYEFRRNPPLYLD